MRSAPLYLLDTNVVSVFGMPKPNPDVIDWIEVAPTGSLGIAWSTVFELLYGIETARDAGSRRTDAYERALGQLLDDQRFRVLRPTTEAARTRARMHTTPAMRNFLVQQPSSRKQPTGEDLTNAATPIAARAGVVASNIRHFSAIDRLFSLPGLLDPVADRWVEAVVLASRMGAGRHIVVGELFATEGPPIRKATPLAVSRVDIVRQSPQPTGPFAPASKIVASSAQHETNLADGSNFLRDVKGNATRFRQMLPSLAKGSPNRSNRSLHELSDRRSIRVPSTASRRGRLNGEGQSRPRLLGQPSKGVPGKGG